LHTLELCIKGERDLHVQRWYYLCVAWMSVMLLQSMSWKLMNQGGDRMWNSYIHTDFVLNHLRDLTCGIKKQEMWWYNSDSTWQHLLRVMHLSFPSSSPTGCPLTDGRSSDGIPLIDKYDGSPIANNN
jgi:hypothetical protein